MTSTATKFRLRFAKQGDLRLVSHHDLMRCLERMFRRAALPVAHSQGFNPRPKAVFPLSLALGIEGRHEVLELELTEPFEPDALRDRLSAVAPAGLDFLEAEAIPPGRSSQVASVAFELPVPSDRAEAAQDALRAFLASESWPYRRHRPDRGRTLDVDLRPFVLDAHLGEDSALRFRLKIEANGSARPEEIVEAVGLRDLLAAGAVLARTEVTLVPRPAAAATSHELSPRPAPDARPDAEAAGTDPESGPHEERNAD